MPTEARCLNSQVKDTLTKRVESSAAAQLFFNSCLSSRLHAWQKDEEVMLVVPLGKGDTPPPAVITLLYRNARMREGCRLERGRGAPH